MACILVRRCGSGYTTMRTTGPIVNCQTEREMEQPVEVLLSRGLEMAPVTPGHRPLGGMYTPNQRPQPGVPKGSNTWKETGGAHLSSLAGTYLGIGISYTRLWTLPVQRSGHSKWGCFHQGRSSCWPGHYELLLPKGQQTRVSNVVGKTDPDHVRR